MEELLKDYKNEIRKLNILGFIRITLSCLLGIIFILTKVLFGLGIVCMFLTIFFVLSYIFNRMMNKEIYMKCTKEHKIDFEKYDVTHKMFVEECKKGIPDDTYIVVNNIIYSICANKNSYYINFKKFKKIDEFLSYKLDGELYLDNLKKVTFLQINGNDPKSYFEEEK